MIIGGRYSGVALPTANVGESRIKRIVRNAARVIFPPLLQRILPLARRSVNTCMLSSSTANSVAKHQRSSRSECTLQIWEDMFRVQ